MSLRIDYGEFVAIIGSSGSGKSTMMNILGCPDVPTRGQYYLAGQQAATLSDNALALARNQKIGFIFQGYNLIPALDALENVELPLIYQGVPADQRHERPWKHWSAWGCPASGKAHSRPSEMSGGTAAARRHCTGHLHPRACPYGGRTRRGAELQDRRPCVGDSPPLHDEGATIIQITHDNTAAATAERVVCVSDGIITLDVSREEVDL